MDVIIKEALYQYVKPKETEKETPKVVEEPKIEEVKIKKSRTLKAKPNTEILDWVSV